MKFQFEVPDEVAEAHAFLSKRTAFFGMSPRLLTIQLYMRALDAEKQLVAASAPKPIAAPKPTAAQRKLDECKAREDAYQAKKDEEAQHEARVRAGWAAHEAAKLLAEKEIQNDC